MSRDAAHRRPARATPASIPHWRGAASLVKLISALLVSLSIGSLWCAAQAAETERSGNVFDSIQRFIEKLGEKTEELIGPRLGPLDGWTAEEWAELTVRDRDIEHNSKILRANALIDVASELAEGRIQIEAWENPIMQLTATVTVGAESEDLANQLLEGIGINVTESPDGDFVQIRPQYPDTRDQGRVNISTSFMLRVPPTARVHCANNFGDTMVRGVGGDLVVNSQWGAVDIRDIGGVVRARAWGEFALRAVGLRQGGTFDLQGSLAEFANVSGPLRINAFTGSVTVRDMPAGSELDVRSESGPVTLVIPDAAEPAIQATAIDGVLRSDLGMERKDMGRLATGRLTTTDPTHRITANVSFGDLEIRSESGPDTTAAPSIAGGVETYDVHEYSDPLDAAAELVVESVAGDIRIEGVDGDRLEVRVTRVVRVDRTDNAPLALEALAVRREAINGRMHVRAAVNDNMEALGCSLYRVNLEIRCPRGTSVSVFAPSGATRINGMNGAITIKQEKGTVTVEQAQSDAVIDITNNAGDINLFDSKGPATISARKGAVHTRAVSGKQVISVEGGKTLVDSPQGEVVLRQRGGDAQVVALAGILGVMDLSVEDGNIGLLAPRSSNAVFYVRTENGEIYPSIPLDGTIEQGVRSFTGRLNEGEHRVDLFTKNGDIYLD